MTSPSTVGTINSGGIKCQILRHTALLQWVMTCTHSLTLLYSYNGVSLGSTTGNNFVIYVISGVISACALVLLFFIIIPLCVIIGKRQFIKKRVVLNAGR